MRRKIQLKWLKLRKLFRAGAENEIDWLDRGKSSNLRQQIEKIKNNGCGGKHEAVEEIHENAYNNKKRHLLANSYCLSRVGNRTVTSLMALGKEELGFIAKIRPCDAHFFRRSSFLLCLYFGQSGLKDGRYEHVGIINERNFLFCRSVVFRSGSRPIKINLGAENKDLNVSYVTVN